MSTDLLLEKGLVPTVWVVKWFTGNKDGVRMLSRALA